MSDNARGPSRRQLLAGGGIAVTLGLAGFVLFEEADSSDPAPVPTSGWLFGPFRQGITTPEFVESGMAEVTLPHCVAPLSWREWKPATWERVWAYRAHFDLPREAKTDRLFFEVGAGLTVCSVYLNGQLIGAHAGGYLPFRFELTGRLQQKDNVLAVVVDGRWRNDVPPNRPKSALPSAIDFYQPAGLYRAATLRHRPGIFLDEVFAKTLDVLIDQRRIEISAIIDAAQTARSAVLRSQLLDGDKVVAEGKLEISGITKGRTPTSLTLAPLPEVTLWDVDNPHLYSVRTTLSVGAKAVDHHQVRIGFREAEFRLDGFFLNGRRLKLFGLNRHQWYPYVGAAMPDRVQRKDAEILRNELNCNMVRCSHYPQSEAFLDACDELGLLVWEEAPGWDYIGDDAWRKRVLRDVHDMVVRDRNHPSIIVWGTRLNETVDDTQLYIPTDTIAKSLDGTRATSGAINRAPHEVGPIRTDPAGKAKDPYSTTALSQDVFAYNDYSKPRMPDGMPSLRPPRIDLPYLISEAVGTIVGPPYYRRVDAQHIQAAQPLLHAAVHSVASSDDRYCGLLAWCGFDYPSGWYHTFQGIKWPGVYDIFRTGKLGAAFYRAQVDPSIRAVIEPGFHWGMGAHYRSNKRGVTIYSNCDTLVLTIDGRETRTLQPDTEDFTYLRYPPFQTELAFPDRTPAELRIDGYLDGELALTRQFSADTGYDRLAVALDDTELHADGSDATRLELRCTDKYGNLRPFVSGDVAISMAGPATLIGDNPFPISATGGAGAVWIRATRKPGVVTIRASHPKLGTAQARLTVR